MNHRKFLVRKGNSLVEIMVVMAIIGVLVGILMPAVQRTREAVSRVSCANNLRQIGTATGMYQNEYGVFPNEDSNKQQSLLFVSLLPFLEAKDLTPDQGLPTLICPSRRSSPAGDKLDYAAGGQGTMGSANLFSVLGGKESAPADPVISGTPIGGFWASINNPTDPYHYIYVTYKTPEIPDPVFDPADPTAFMAADRIVPGQFGMMNPIWFRGFPTAGNTGQTNRIATFWNDAGSGMPIELNGIFHMCLIQGQFTSFDSINPGAGSQLYHGSFGKDWGLNLSGPPQPEPPPYPWKDAPFYPGSDPAYNHFFRGDYHAGFGTVSFTVPASMSVAIPGVNFNGVSMTEIINEGTSCTLLLSHKELNSRNYLGGDTNDGSWRTTGHPYNYQRDVIDRPPTHDSRANTPGTGFSSPHGNCLSLFADGSVRPVAFTIPGEIWTALWTCNGFEAFDASTIE